MKKRFEVTEEWVERLIAEAQEEERRNPISNEEFAASIKSAQQYGAERLKALGITSEEQLNEILSQDREERRQIRNHR